MAQLELYFYHKTSLEQAKKLMTTDIAPVAVPEYALLDWREYTDFGKGFYTHPEENKHLAFKWAKERNKEWGVVRLCLTKAEFANIPGTALHFHNKKEHRPPNAPILFDRKQANWIEFVEYNRHIRTSIQRPKDNDWTKDYPWMRGPIWVGADSRVLIFPDYIQQINWGLGGLKALNADVAKRRRFLINKDNERLDPDKSYTPGRSIGYKVPLIPQTTVMGCWAAGVAMILGWRDRISIDPSTIAQNPGGAPYLAQLQAGLNPNDVYILRRWGLVVQAPQSYSVEGFAQLLERHGPLWVAAAVPFAHIRVVTGIDVDPNPNAAHVYINDPWELGMRIFRWPNSGARYSRTYTQFVAEAENLARAEMGQPAPVYVAHLP